MREFYLINGKGNRYSLMDVNHWLHEPSNLGAKFNSKYEQIGANFVRTKRITAPDDITGTVMFTGGDLYAKYSEFVRFITIEPLTLVYVSSEEYQVSVDVVSVSKSEIDTDRTLKCEINLKRLSRWYKPINLYNNGDVSGGKVYDYSFDYHYTEDEPETAIVQSDSGYESPTKITIYGPIKNPYWMHYINGDLVTQGSVTCEITSDKKLVIDCTSIPYSIKECNIANNQVRDLYGFSNFEQKRFVFLGSGKNRIVVDHEGTNTLKLSVEARLEYETV